ncbi:Hypothetical predicted protein [Pelobates cultripes]|uniref:Uncharacterized protein n=1 Tax=Pelobates cultripes TaxID=61616 RepID=A0AAD1W286_PELCU|nr:Hypothetical predicted protein [Pelobates cultripes]
MEYLLEVSLLVGLAMMVDAAPFIPNDFTDKITDAINYYNMESESKSLFKLLEDKDINNLNHSKKIETIIIVIQETVCLKSQYLSRESCPFKNGGEVRECIVSIDKSDLSVASNVRCETMSDSVGNGPDKCRQMQSTSNHDGNMTTNPGNKHRKDREGTKMLIRPVR